MSLCPETKMFPCPAVSLFRDRKRFYCPSVTLSRDKSSSKNPKTNSSVLGRNGRGCQNPDRALRQNVQVPSRSGLSHAKISKSCPGPPHSKILSLSHCSFVPGLELLFPISVLTFILETYCSKSLYFCQSKYMQYTSSVVEPRHTDLNRNKTKDTLVPQGLQDSFWLKTDLGT